MKRTETVPFTETETDTEKDGLLKQTAARRRKSPTGRGSQVVVTATADAIKRRGLPPMDPRLKSILAGQAGILLRGGWPLEEVRQAAIDLGLSWDEKRGHNRLCHLAARLRRLDADRQTQAHEALMKEDKATWAAQGIQIMGGRPMPTTHDFKPSGRDRLSCEFCEGPWGVHVKARVDVA